ncbi:MAG: hypothetical protein ACWGOX_10600 [Desulforhopalus sp.]
MKNAKSYQGKDLTNSQNIDEMLEHGRKLHSEAVFMGLMKIITLFKPAAGNTVRLPEGEKHMGFSR